MSVCHDAPFPCLAVTKRLRLDQSWQFYLSIRPENVKFEDFGLALTFFLAAGTRLLVARGPEGSAVSGKLTG